MSKAKAKSGAKLSGKNIGAGVLMGILALSLLGFGADGFSTTIRHVATVGDRKIDANDYSRAMQNELRALQAQIGAGFTMEQARLFGLDRMVLEQLVTNAVLDLEAQRIGLSVGDPTVQREILEVRSFQGASGQFDREAYRFALQSAGLSEAVFEEQIRADVTRSILQLAVAGAAQAPQAMVAPLLDYQAQTRDLSVLTLTAADLATPVGQPTAAELDTWYHDNTDRYSLPAGKRIRYVWLTPEMIVDGLNIDETMLRDAYRARLDEFVQPERRLVERLIFSDSATAEAALARIQSGTAGFADLVTERGLTLDDADMGDVTEAQLGAAGAGVFAMPEPGVAGPFDTPLGPALFQMNGILAARETPFEDAIPVLRDELAMDRARRILADDLDRFEDLLAGGATLDEMASETEMKLDQIDWRTGDTDGIAAYEAFRNAASSIATGDFPELLVLDDGGLFAMELVDDIPAAPQPLDDIRTRVTQDWQNAQIVARLRAQAEALGTIPEGDDAAVPARFTGITRFDFLPDLPPSVLQAAFEMTQGETRILDSGASVQIVTLDGIVSPDVLLDQVAQMQAALNAQLAQSLGQDLFSYFATALRAGQPIQVNQSVIDAVQANF
jgi:peptidyl-prolyl cis-trans isomerase D